jgi:hypothetical protein
MFRSLDLVSGVSHEAGEDKAETRANDMRSKTKLGKSMR